jgi:hypothetical protein
MPRNLSGTYTLPSGNPVTAGTTITTTWANNTLNDIATALTQSVSSDGQTTWTGDMVAGNNKITGLANGSAADDSATIGQVQGNTFAMLGAVSGADTITATASPPITAYATGQTFRFVSAGANTGAVTLNLNSLGAKAVTKTGTTALAAGDIPSGAVVEVIYDGTQFQMLGLAPTGSPTFTGTVTIGASTANQTISTNITETVTSSTASRPYYSMENTTADATAAGLLFYKSRGGLATSNNDELLKVEAYGRDTNNAARQAAGISVQGAAPGAAYVPGAVVVKTTNSSGTLQENFRVDATGVVRLAGEAAPTGYTSRGDLVLPAARATRAINTAKGWVQFAMGGGGATLNGSSGGVTVARVSTGIYTITFPNAIASNSNAISAAVTVQTGSYAPIARINSMTTSSIDVQIVNASGLGVTDTGTVHVQAYGDI